MDLMGYYSLFWVCIIGLCLGSFYNVVILRSLTDESIIFPASKCPKCNHKLLWWHNIPVLSFILLKGKCYFCKEKISLQYPIIELLTMGMFAFIYLIFGLTIKAIFIAIWVSCLLIMCVTDLKEKIVDCNIAIIMAISGCIYQFITGGWHALWYSILGIIAGAVILEFIARIGYIIAGGRAMGEADTYVAGALGAIAGISNIIPVLLYGLIASMLFIIPMFLYQKYKSNDKKTCILLILFMLFVVYFKTINQGYIGLFALIITGVALAASVMKSIRSEENRSYIPYVPALALGGLYFIMSM